MNTCPKCGGRVRLRNLGGSRPCFCDHCGAALEFVPWRLAVLSAISLVVAGMAAEQLAHAHRWLRLVLMLAAYFAALSIGAPFLLRLKPAKDPADPLSIR